MLLASVPGDMKAVEAFDIQGFNKHERSAHDEREIMLLSELFGEQKRKVSELSASL
jgi:hypothetical protein